MQPQPHRFRAPLGGGAASPALFVAILVSVTLQPPLAAQNCPASPGSGNPCVLTGQYDNHRDGYNDNEIYLNSNTVCPTACGVTQVLVEVIPGDQIVCGCTTPSCPVVTQVISDTQLTLSQPLPGSCNISTSTIYYAGHFINPAVDQYPNPDSTGYPGGSLVIAGCQTTSTSAPTCESSGTLVNSDTAVVWAISTADTNSDGTESGGTIRTQGWLHAYRAKPTSGGLLQQLWNNTATDCGAACQTWCASSFALPTVANGKVFVPTYAINLNTTENGPPCPDVDYTGNSFQSGIWVAGIPQQ